MTPAVPWNSMELGGRQFRWHEQFHGTRSAPISMTWAVPWNSMELGVRQFRWNEQFYGITWNLGCTNFADMSNSMELIARQFRWHEQFHGIPWNLEGAISMTRAVPRNSMELEVRPFRWHEQFHGIPWKLECVNFDETNSSMELHGTWGAPISMTPAVPWNSMELGVRPFRWHEQFHGIPWN